MWISPLFGEEFGAAIVPTLMLLLSALICIPGLMAASGIAAWGQPGRRSIGLGFTLVTNIGALVILVPHFGVFGACWTSILSNVLMTSFMVVVAARLMHEPVQSFWRVRASDAVLAWREGARLARRGLGWIPLARTHGSRRP